MRKADLSNRQRQAEEQMNDEFAKYGAVAKRSGAGVAHQLKPKRYQPFEPALGFERKTGTTPGPIKAYDPAQGGRGIGSAKLSQQSAQNDVVSTNPSSQAALNHMSSTCDAAGFGTQKLCSKNPLLRMSGGLEPIKEAKQLKSGQIVELGKIDHARAQQKLARVSAAAASNTDLIRSLPSFAP
jgi:hypothetical protein